MTNNKNTLSSLVPSGINLIEPIKYSSRYINLEYNVCNVLLRGYNQIVALASLQPPRRSDVLWVRFPYRTIIYVTLK